MHNKTTSHLTARISSTTERLDHKLIQRFVSRPLRKAHRQLRTGGPARLAESTQAEHYTVERGERIYLLVCFILRTLLAQTDGLAKPIAGASLSFSALFKKGTPKIEVSEQPAPSAPSAPIEPDRSRRVARTNSLVSSSTTSAESASSLTSSLVSVPSDADPEPSEPSSANASTASESVSTGASDQFGQTLLLHATVATPHHAQQFYRLLHDLQPIYDVGQHVRRYPGASELLAIRHCKELESILKSWEISALADLEQRRTTLLDLRNLELLLLFAEEQQKAIKTIAQRKARHLKRWQLDHRVERMSSSLKETDEFSIPMPTSLAGTNTGTGPQTRSNTSTEMGAASDNAASQSGQVNSDFQLLLRLNGQSIRCELTAALQLVQLVKKRAEQHVHVRTIYVRCIKELLRINVSNLMRLYTWSLRTRTVGTMEHDKCLSVSRSIV